MNSVSVWTYNDDPGWVRRNDGPEMVVCDHLSMGQARFLCQQLLILNPAGKFEIRDGARAVLCTFENRAPLESSDRPRRRTLGNRQA